MARVLNRNIGHILLAIFLILTGLTQIIGLSFSGLPMLLGILALLAGILILAGR